MSVGREWKVGGVVVDKATGVVDGRGLERKGRQGRSEHFGMVGVNGVNGVNAIKSRRVYCL